MGDEAGAGVLFEGLAELRGPERQQGGRPRLRRAERGQQEFRQCSLDELLPPDHRARLVWAFVETLDLSALYARIKGVEGAPGHPTTDPKILMALWLYATTEGVGSARALARLCESHVAYEWIRGGVGMNHKTLADFRVGHGPVLEKLLVDGFTALLASGVASLDRVAQDGMRVRAKAGSSSFRRPGKLRELRREAQAEVTRLRAELEDDPEVQERRRRAAQLRAAEDRARRVAQASAIAEELAAQEAARVPQPRAQADEEDGGDAGDPPTDADKPSRRKEPRVSTTDPQARVMKMADGGFRPAYNVQMAVDTTSGLIARIDVDAVGSDGGKLRPMSDALEETYGTRPREHLADGGFAKLDDIVPLDAQGVCVYVPPPEPRGGRRSKYEPRPNDKPAIAAWRMRMGTPQAQAIYAERAASVEWANAQGRAYGLRQFVVAGCAKVKAVVLWTALAINMTTSHRLRRIEEERLAPAA